MSLQDPSSNSFGETASSLLRRVQFKDEHAWTRLTKLYGPLVFYWCRRLGLADQDSADVIQEVFVSVARGIGRFELQREGTFRGWLWKITRNKVVDRRRRQPDEPDGEGGTVAQARWAAVVDPLQDNPLQEDDPVDSGEMASLVRRALDLIQGDFEPVTWQAFWRSAVEQQPTDQIAADLGISPSSVRQAKSRVLRRLRLTLGDLDS